MACYSELGTVVVIALQMEVINFAVVLAIVQLRELLFSNNFSICGYRQYNVAVTDKVHYTKKLRIFVNINCQLDLSTKIKANSETTQNI